MAKEVHSTECNDHGICCLTEHGDSQLKAQLQCQTGGNVLQRWGAVQDLYMARCSQQESYLNLKPKGWKQEWSHLTNTPNDPLGNFVLPVLPGLDSAGLEVLVPKRDTPRGTHQVFHWIINYG